MELNFFVLCNGPVSGFFKNIFTFYLDVICRRTNQKTGMKIKIIQYLILYHIIILDFLAFYLEMWYAEWQPKNWYQNKNYKSDIFPIVLLAQQYHNYAVEGREMVIWTFMSFNLEFQQQKSGEKKEIGTFFFSAGWRKLRYWVSNRH